MLITLHAQKDACAYQLRVIINEYYVVEVDVVWDPSSQKNAQKCDTNEDPGNSNYT